MSFVPSDHPWPIRRIRSSLGDETGKVGPSVLLGLVGGVFGLPLGVLVATFLFEATCGTGPPGSLGNAERCGGLGGLLFLVVGVPAGVVVGAVVGAVAGSRKPWSAAEGGGASSEPRLFTGPPVHREATASSWVAVVAGLAMSYGAMAHWRSVTIFAEDLDRYGLVLRAGPEGFGFFGGLLVLTAGILRVLRPVAPVPTVLIGIGVCLSATGLVWGMVDLLGVPSELQRHVFNGYWYSVAGTLLGAVAWRIDPKVGRSSTGEGPIEV